MTLCGALRLDGAPADPGLVRRMLAASVTAGPGQGRFAHSDGPLALAASALPALGPAPQVHVSDTLAAVVHGRIDRPAGAAGELAPAARVAAAYLRGTGGTGLHAFDDLGGDWLLALWDAGRQRLVLARAMNGSRRVLTWSDGRLLLFGTEFAQLHAGGAPARLDERWVAEQLCQVATRPGATGLAGVERLPEGELLVAGPGADPARLVFDSLRDTVAEPAPVDLGTAAAGLRPRLERAVEAALPAGGAAGVLLGEGAGAGIVAAVAAGLAAAGRWDGRLLPVALVGPGAGPDRVGAVEDHLGAAVLRVGAEPYDWDGWRDWSAATWELPARPDAAAADTLAGALAAEGAAVALGGDGGDDWFGGWPGRPAAVRAGALARARRRWSARPRRGARPGLAAPPWVDAGWLARLGLPELAAAAERADRDAARGPDHARRWRPARRRALLPAREGMQLRLNAHGIDWRHPLHEREVVEYALGLHPEVLREPVLLAAAAELVPPATGAPAGDPVGDAIAAAGGPAALADSRLVKEGWVDLEAAGLAWAHERAAEAMWPLFALAAWLEAVPGS